jgi:hypothetical protein
MRELSDHILDIVQNSITAGSNHTKIEITADTNEDSFKIIVNDNGHGMSEEFLKNVISPFSTSRRTRKVGLGIPMFIKTTEHCNGSFDIYSKVGKSTKVIAKLSLSHIDRPPLGEIADAMHILVVSNPGLDFFIIFKCDKKEFVFDTKQVKNVLGDVTLDNSDVSLWIKQSLKDGKTLVFGGITV